MLCVAMLQNYEEGHYTKVRFESGIIFSHARLIIYLSCDVQIRILLSFRIKESTLEGFGFSSLQITRTAEG